MATDSDLRKMDIADACRRRRTDGFQGCKNYGYGCDFGGFYLACYSCEGLCANCELKQFPDRFNGCPFCGYVIRHSTFCWECDHSFSEWLFNVFYNKNPSSRSTMSIFDIKNDNETNDWNLWLCVITGIRFLIIHNTHGVPFRHMEFAYLSPSKQWKGFHTGNEQFTWIDPFEFKKHVDISDITWDNKEDVLMRELKKNGIRIYEEIQI